METISADLERELSLQARPATHSLLLSILFARLEDQQPGAVSEISQSFDRAAKISEGKDAASIRLTELMIAEKNSVLEIALMDLPSSQS